MRWKLIYASTLTVLLGLILLPGCRREGSPTSTPAGGVTAPRYAKAATPGKKLVLQSPAFEEGASLPQTFTCNGENVSPPLSWTGVPPAAKSLALLCVDPDAPGGTWVHWVVYNLPANIDKLRQNAHAYPASPFEGIMGINDFKARSYGGACPPAGTGVHRYIFTLYALDTKLTLKNGTASELLQAMDGHLLSQGELMAKYAHP